MLKFETALLLSIGSGDAEHEFQRLVVEYRYVKGSPAYTPRGEYAPIDPPEPEHAEIGNVYVVTEEVVRGVKTLDARHPLPEWMVEPITEQLERLCLDHYHGERDAALERRAEERRDDDMIDRIERPNVAAE